MAKTPPAATIKTFGCRLNIWESEVMARHLEAAALKDAVVINTCAVTAEAEKQARQMIRKIRREDPDKRIVVTGCAAQIDPSAWQGMPEVDAVIGNHDKLDAATWARLAGNNDDQWPSLVSDIMAVEDVAPHLLEGFDGHTRAFLQIQQGCDHRCTFCIIPYGRGQNRSVPMEVIIRQVETLADHGVAEVVLTGVDVASWGGDLDGAPRLGQLVRRLLRQAPSLKRLRMSSIDPAAIDEDLLLALAEDQRLMPHLHLSVQHGDDLILKRMKRRHLRGDVLALVERVRDVRPETVFGADLIAGFPTEDDAAHHNSLKLIAEAGLTWLHVFPYSPRDSTPAARMPQHSASVIKSRAADLRQAAKDAENAFLQTRLGQTEEVLLETGGVGHTAQFAKARLISDGAQAGQIYPVRVRGIVDNMLDVELR
ncbi:MAG: tRNA (N(6)-L-threonylcarbamoyladenosine(37)-C(2))-methylthiotransferase MtaB [Alphaproteobacteria bacterium]